LASTSFTQSMTIQSNAAIRSVSNMPHPERDFPAACMASLASAMP
jgi:hypothetical protein